MPTPDEVLTCIGNSLVHGGWIKAFEIRDHVTNRKVEDRPDRTLHLTLNDVNGPPLVIRSRHDREQRVLTLAGNACPETQVDLIQPSRGFAVNKKPAVTVGAAIRVVLDHFQKSLGSAPPRK